jgi:ADP-ribosylglycohydrolase
MNPVVNQMTPLQKARTSLEGLSVGDAFGQMFFDINGVYEVTEARRLPASPWYYTDDTVMALSIYDCLEKHSKIDADALAKLFAYRYTNDPARGYGGGMHDTLRAIQQGEPWQQVTTAAFSGMGSFGNGAAMRVAPLGAYFSDDLGCVVSEATLSARVTHAHPEGIAGAVAVAVATALASQSKQLEAREFILEVAAHTPESEVKSKILRAAKFNQHTPIETAIHQLGVGWQVSAQDTVPFCIWCAAKHLDNFIEAMWYTVSALGDRDTTCAIVGGIVAARVGINGIPSIWRNAREELQIWEGETL